MERWGSTLIARLCKYMVRAHERSLVEVSAIASVQRPTACASNVQ